jgi:GDP-L-galactose phosphorylase
VLPGDHNFVATLIEGRDQKKRTTEFGINQVLQPFDSAKFDFTKVSPDEVIFRFHESEKDSSECFDDAPHAVSASPSAILINVSISPPTDDSISFCLADTITKSFCSSFCVLQVSPIGYCHVLLTPRIQDFLPQRIDQESFLLAMYVAREARDPFFRVGYNSLGGFAIINHLHFQVSP